LLLAATAPDHPPLLSALPTLKHVQTLVQIEPIDGDDLGSSDDEEEEEEGEDAWEQKFDDE